MVFSITISAPTPLCQQIREKKNKLVKQMLSALAANIYKFSLGGTREDVKGGMHPQIGCKVGKAIQKMGV